ncbi:MBL fold metallo-hydrolase [Inquilinus limosus]|uniref:Beta-lactamase n=1 Tax=Inquilinus limosus MP06 TaxID=1398085 RepID=A0A0A0DAV8_9PROT|nr:MBL fold metallo-hydrolase [Inquilinus limosus]KGM34117.1 beta-lactamase [Inquilinus limosus MP06]
MTLYLCRTCGTQYPDSPAPPAACPICEDDRQYVPESGQAWLTPEELRRDHRVTFTPVEPGLQQLLVEPEFAIGERAFLIPLPDGGVVMWDCLALLDDATEAAIRGMGGLRAIAISHPHYYTTMVDWAHRFGCPVHLHADDREWVQRPDPALSFWTGGTLDLGDGLTVIRCGGHFAGAAVLHWAAGAEGRGVLLSGDTIQGVPDRGWVSFMYSYPNLIPLPAAAVQGIADAVAPYEFDRLYGAFVGRQVKSDARGAVLRSADRYIRAIRGG